MHFVKLASLGNDFILLEDSRRPSEFGPLVRALCDRRCGVGADGVLLLLPAEERADARVEVWNSDGSEAEVSGNGLRCAARHLADRGRVEASASFETRAGIVRVRLEAGGGIHVPLGEPRLHPADIPMRADGERFVEKKLDGVPLPLTALSLGNPHAVVFVDGAVAASRLGPVIESHPAFPQRTNVEFVRVSSRERLVVLLWERGVGPTASSGTGAAAALAAAVITGRAERTAVVEMEGGALEAGWDDAGVWTRAPARAVFSGEWGG